MPPTPSCPNCGEPLVPVEHPGPGTPPWLSPACRRAWWPLELTAAARDVWDPIRRVHRGRAGRALRELLADPDARDRPDLPGGTPTPPAPDRPGRPDRPRSS